LLLGWLDEVVRPRPLLKMRSSPDLSVKGEVLRMASFDERDVPKVPVVLMGGPLDGQKYALPRVPPKLEVPLALSLPLKQPAFSAPFARYGRAPDDGLVAGFYVFLFEDRVGPNGETVLYAPPTDELGSQRVAKVVSRPIGSH
jgi:hypothetical protein